MFERSRLVRFLLVLLVVAALGPPASAQFGSSPDWSSKLDPVLQRRASLLSGRSRIIIRSTDAASIGLVGSVVRQAGGTPGRRLLMIDSQVAEVPNARLAPIARSPYVRRISLDRQIVGAMERTGATVGAATVHQAAGYDGSGVGVAIIDSGVTPWHDDLTGAAAGSQRVARFVDLVEGHATPYDDHGHGTHVAGIIAGNGFDSGGARTGIAPGAHLVVLKALDGTGRGRVSDVIAALEHVVAHRDALNIRVVNLSVAAGVYESYRSDPLALAAHRTVTAGIVVVAAAGNHGRSPDGRRQYGGITAPGNAPWVLTVGAASHMGTSDRADDTMAAFSSRGPTAVDHVAKPDLVAPGVGIESLSDPGSAFYTTRSAYLLSGTVPTPYLPYLSLSGTSMAAPAVSGTVALMLQANPALTPNAIKAILQYTAQPHPGYDRLTQGAGFLDTQGAVELAQFFAAPSGAAYPSSAHWGRQVIWGNYLIRGGRLLADANAWASRVTWGAAATPGGRSVAWGVICSDTNCEDGDGTWRRWAWGESPSRNVVWGASCGGADCEGAWSTSTGGHTAASDDDTVVWGTTEDDDTVVWGTSEVDDTVVWGTSEDDDTVVWGTGVDDDTVVWGTSCTDPSCEPVIWSGR